VVFKSLPRVKNDSLNPKAFHQRPTTQEDSGRFRCLMNKLPIKTLELESPIRPFDTDEKGEALLFRE
jgi:hypothetical protein